MKKLIQLFAVSFLLLYFQSGYAQVNLVPNPSFEDTIGCPSDISQIDSTQFWFNPSLMTNPDFFHVCSSMIGVGNPINAFGHQNAKTGIAYAGFYVLSLNNPNAARDYISVKLTDSLQLGKKYVVSIFVSPADKFQYAISTIGVYFSKDSISSSSFGYLDSIPQIENPYGNQITDTTSWTLISDTLIAQGGERFITIGNFRTNDQSDTVFQPSGLNGWNSSYYYIDDVSVIEDTSTGIGITTKPWDSEIRVYPNPSKGKFQIDGMSNGNSIVELYTVLGEKIYQLHYLNQGSITVDLSTFSSGIYCIKISTEQGVVVRKVLKE